MAAITLQNVGVSFPLFFAGDRSFKWKLLGSMSGGQPTSQRTTIHALDDITLSVPGGTRLSLMGGNAAGKTTLLRVMAGLLTPSRGQAEITGRAMSLLGTGIGIDPGFTVRQTIIGHGLLTGFTLAACRDRLAHAVDFSELGKLLDQPLNTLAQGDQVRVALGAAVAYEADILLIDEMIEHLAPVMIDRLCNHIENGMPQDSIVVIAERSMSLLERSCDQAVLLQQGRLMDKGTLADMGARHQALLTA